MHQSQLDIVDLSLSSSEPRLNAILEHPLLDGTKTYTVEVTEFTCPLFNEPPLPSYINFSDFTASMFLFQVKRRIVGIAPNANNNQLNGDVRLRVQEGTVIDPLAPNVVDPDEDFIPFEMFMPSSRYPVQTPNDLVFHMQSFFTNLKQLYIQKNGMKNSIGLTNANAFRADPWVEVRLSPNGTIRIEKSRLFVRNMFIEFSAFSQRLFATPEYMSGRIANGVLLTGSEGLLVNDLIVAGDPNEMVVTYGDNPLTRYFEHRTRVYIDAASMPIPATSRWTTSDKGTVTHTIASFPIQTRFRTSLNMNTAGAVLGGVQFESTLLSGVNVFRRAEDKVSERYQMLNTKFFQNIVLSARIERRKWDANPNSSTYKQYVFTSSDLTMAEGDTWTAKLRFRTTSR